MLTVRGIYEDGKIKLLDKVPVSAKQKVLITFMEEEEDEARDVSLKPSAQEWKNYLSDEREDLYQEYVKK